MYIYLDESGDPGFKFDEGSSRHLVIALLITRRPTDIERCVKRIRQRRLKKSLKELPEIKFNNSDEIIRKAVLECLSGASFEVAYIVLDKDRVYTHLRRHRNELYRFVSGALMVSIPILQKREPVSLIVDKRLSSALLRADFDSYVSMKARENNYHVKISHKNSRNDRCLQAADFISGAIFRFYESGDDTYYSIIRDKIVVSKRMFE